jgi:DNA-directed RNA polymerase
VVTGEMDLLDQQRELEDSSLSMGAARFRRKLRNAQEKGVETTVGGPRKLMRDYMEPLTEAIRYLCERSGKGRRHECVRLCRLVGYDVAAYMTLKVVLDQLSQVTRVKEVAHRIVGLIFDELRYRRLQAEAPQLFKWKLNNFNTSSYHHMKRSLDAAARSIRVCPEHVGKACDCPDSKKRPLDLSDTD